MAIINNNVQNVKFLRNQTPFESRELARAGLEQNKAQAADGTALLARYTADNDVKTLVGFVAEVNSTKYVTIFDVEGGSADVEALRQEINAKLGSGVSSANTVTAQLTALSGNSSTDTSATTSVEGAKKYAYDLIGTLDYTDTAVTGSYVSEVTQSDGKIISTTKVALPTVNAISVAGKPITAVSETLGEISASAGTIEAQYVTATGFTATNVQGALEEVNANIGEAISGLDYSDSAVAKKFVKSVSETDGVIAVERGSITSSGKTIVLSDNADGGVNFEANVDGTTIIVNENTGVMSVASSALVQYEGDGKTVQISAVQNSVRTVSSPLTISSTTVTDTNVKEQFNLVNASGETVGATIKIYKDSSLYNVYLGHVDDSIAGDPPVVTSGTGDTALCFIYHKEDGSYELVPVNVETFLEETEFESGVTATNHIVHGVVDSTSEKDSQSTPVDFLTVGADGFKISGIKDEIDRKINALDATGGTQTIATDKHVAVEVVEANGLITAVTVTEDNIADADDLAALSAKTVTEVASSNSSVSATSSATADGTVKYDIVTDADKIQMSGFTTTTGSPLSAITEADSISTAFEKLDGVIAENEQVTSEALNDLDGRLDVIESDFISGITVNGSGVTVTNNIAALTIVSAASTDATESPIDVTTSNNGGVTLTFQGIDCGCYDGTNP